VDTHFHFFTAMIKRIILAHQGLHPPYTRRELSIFYVQFDIGRELTCVAMGTQVIRAQQFHLAHDAN
jgi:hypothetical protein